MNIKKRSPVLLLLFIISVAMLLSACRGNRIADKDGAALRYKLSDIEEKGMEGLFTMNSDKTFSPLPYGIPGYAGRTSEASDARYIWYTDNGQNFTSLIPTVTEETPIVIIYNNDATMPSRSSWYLERYEPMGATIGAHVSLSSDKRMYLSEENMLFGTSARSVFSSEETESRDRQHEIIEISGARVKLPVSNVERNVNMLLGLSYGKKYTFTYLQGTKTKTADIVSDVYAFQSKEIIRMDAPYKTTDKGYFIINIPRGIPKGFYYISDLGFFYFKGETD